MTTSANIPTLWLQNRCVGLSMSQADDLARLGLMESHFRIAARELIRLVLTSGGTLVYGGDLRPEGYTWLLIDELRRYAPRSGIGLEICLSWIEHRSQPLSRLREVDAALKPFGQLVCMNADGQPYPDALDCSVGREEAPPEPKIPPPQMTEAERSQMNQRLTEMRHYITERCTARLLIGGSRRDFMGDQPGLLQEALMSLQATPPRPVFLAGGFGGITLRMVAEMDPDLRDLLPDAPEPDQRTTPALLAFSAAIQGRGWSALNNGLDDDQNRQLATTYRPSEIAALVSHGLGQLKR